MTVVLLGHEVPEHDTVIVASPRFASLLPVDKGFVESDGTVVLTVLITGTNAAQASDDNVGVVCVTGVRTVPLPVVKTGKDQLSVAEESRSMAISS